MKMKRDISKICSALVFGLAAISCSLDETADIKLVELGTPLENNICFVEAAGGEYDVEVLSNGAYHVEFTENDWLTLSALQGNGDGRIKLTATPNKEFKRMTSFVLCSDVDTRRDTVYVKQKGDIEASLSMDNTSLVLPGAGGQSTAAIRTNIPFSYLESSVAYNEFDNVDWLDLSKLSISGEGASQTISISSAPNTDPVSIRSASLYLSFVDGWGDKVALEILLMQKNSNEGLGVL